MSDITNILIDGQRFYHEEEMYRRIKKAYDSGYRRAIELVKEYPEMDASKLVEKMMSDWYNS